MKKEESRRTTGRHSPRAALAAIGLTITSMKLADPIKHRVAVLRKSSAHPFQEVADDDGSGRDRRTLKLKRKIAGRFRT